MVKFPFDLCKHLICQLAEVHSFRDVLAIASSFPSSAMPEVTRQLVVAPGEGPGEWAAKTIIPHQSAGAPSVPESRTEEAIYPPFRSHRPFIQDGGSTRAEDFVYLRIESKEKRSDN